MCVKLRPFIPQALALSAPAEKFFPVTTEVVLNPVAHNAKDFWTGLVYVLIGSAAFYLCRDYGMGTAVKMGPAYFPTVLSGLLILIGTLSIVRSFVREGSPIGKVAVKGLALVTLSIVLFGLLAHPAGMAIALPVMILTGAYGSTRFKWRYALPLAAGITLFCILIFRIGLGVPLPVLGSWFD